ncbi:HK97 family phage prohead protease [Bacillus sp. ISL-46]|uniref:HK97 family phage prohead protease n=1 Tax=Bacillus sp. ISL-46 TaxID=2819129 RepID=UPI001BEA2652|nr:HK97 family phage prohead protease [Bacillus sp. ISL-46]MBT2723055.1 HK97 family phage prohead protease [Bacillus sp. ISL-46]
MNKRTSFLESQFRAEEQEDKLFLEGYFIRYNEETELYAGVFEEVAPTAVLKSLEKNDIRCLFNHDTGVVLGRAGNKTLELKSDEKGLYGKVEINRNDPEAMAIYARIQRGDINACSFGFYPVKEDYEIRNDGSTKFIIREADLFEVSAVTFPAYPQTEISARQNDIEAIKLEKLNTRKKKLKEMLNK